MIGPAATAVSPVRRLRLLVQIRHAASLFRSYDFSDTPTGTWKKVVCRQVLVQLTSGSPFNNLRNKLQAENRDSQIISISQQQQINSVNKLSVCCFVAVIHVLCEKTLY